MVSRNRGHSRVANRPAMGSEAIMPVEHHSSAYFREREAKEREQADRATLPDVREIYLSLAKQYRYLAENAEAAERGERSCTSVVPSPWD